MLHNPRTTLLGYLAMLGGAIFLGQKIWQNHAVTLEDLQGLVVFLTGMGLVAAKDGGH